MAGVRPEHPAIAQLADTEALRLITEHATELISLHRPDGVYLFASAGCRNLLGYEPHELVGRSGVDLIHPDDRADALRVLSRVAELPATTIVFRVGAKDGHWVWVECTAQATGSPTGEVVMVARDVTKRKEAEDRLREADERFRNAFDEAPIGMALTSLDGVFMRVNRALCEMTALEPQEMVGLRITAITHPDDIEADLDAIDRMITGDLETFHTEKRYVRKDGSVIWIQLSATPVHDVEGKPAYFVSQMQDITEQRARHAQLAHRALHDGLTGLANRSHLIEDLELTLAGLAFRPGGGVGLLFLDLDQFKAINDRLGHLGGDVVLVEIGRRLSGAIRAGDTVARMGGDEFVVLCECDGDGADLEELATRLLAVVDRPMSYDGVEVRTTVSIGMSATQDQSATPLVLLGQADRALYDAKRAGRNRWRWCRLA